MPQRHRIALFLPNLTVGGAQHVMLTLAGGFADRGHRVDLLVADLSGPLADRIPPAVEPVNLRAGGAARSIPALAAYLSRERPAALLSTQNHANVAAVVAGRLSTGRTRVVIRQSTVVSKVWPEAAVRPYRSRMLPWLMRRSYPHADAVIAVSQWVARDLEHAAGVSRERLWVVPSPLITPDLFTLAQEPPQHPWLAPDQPPVVLGIGRLRREKGYGTLIEAFALLVRERPARLLIIGDGEERSALDAQVSSLGLEQVTSLPGFTSNPFSYLARAGVFVLPSLREGLSGVLVQALACGCPIVATDSPGGNREVLDDGRYGELVPVGDPVALAAAMSRALDMPRGQRPPSAWQRFSSDYAVEQYLRVLLTDATA